MKPAAALCAAALLSSCAGSKPVVAHLEGRTVELPADRAAMVPRCPLRACWTEDAPQRVRVALEEAFQSAAAEGGGAPCDVVFRGDRVVSGFTKETLLTLEGPPLESAKLACTLLMPDQPAGKALARQRAAAEPPEKGAPPFPILLGKDNALPASELAPVYAAREREEDYAVVIGIERHKSLPKAQYAERDAAAFAAHLRALGVPERNLVLITGSRADRAALDQYFDDWLRRVASKDGRIFLYFRGHAAPDPRTGLQFLLPWEGELANPEESGGFEVPRLLRRLASLKAKSVVAVLDAGVEGGPAGKAIVIASAAADQTPAVLPQKGHGSFAYHFLQGLNGRAGPAKLAGLVTYAASQLADQQTPRLWGDGAAPLR